jgi:hypothetical protein
MSDITVCSGVLCPFSHTCWRALSPRDPVYQSRFVSPPFETVGSADSCDYYWEYDPKDEMEEDE